ncbi:hypothetical protein [Streptomyces carpinensis]|uniref:Uncharacterized protein n=1 Tax=Streptomyces carpinensis TaxID=66369 RepID=A0ABV1W726_9ACTN|nr:hypothetical protein [Streptomyces carpinensis]
MGASMGHMGAKLWENRPTVQASHAFLVIPLGLIVVIVIADVLTGKGVQLGPLLVVAPAVSRTGPFSLLRLPAFGSTSTRR